MLTPCKKHGVFVFLSYGAIKVSPGYDGDFMDIIKTVDSVKTVGIINLLIKDQQ